MTFLPEKLSDCLHYDQTVPKKMVHRAAINEVFITSGRRIADSQFECAAQLPRTHTYFNDHIHQTKYYDILLFVEVFRQASIYISHAFLNVAVTDKFIYSSGNTHILSRETLVVNDCPTNARVSIEVLDEHIRQGVRSGVTLELVIIIDGVAVAQERVALKWINSASWDRMRQKGMATIPNPFNHDIQLPPPIDPAHVGRELKSNVVLGKKFDRSKENISTQVIVNQTNAGLFDHALDHIPGMLIMEAFRQTSLLLVKQSLQFEAHELLFTECNVEFTKFGEFGINTICNAKVVSNDTSGNADVIEILLTMTQLGAIIANGSLKLAAIGINRRANFGADFSFDKEKEVE